MRLFELACLYALIGVGGAAFALTRPASSNRALDAALMLAFWPLYGPFLLARPSAAWQRAGDSEVAFLSALRRAAGTPLAALLPDERSARALARRLRVAADKVREIDALLVRPEFDDAGAALRVEQLSRAGGSDAALGTARSRLSNILRLRRLRDRFARELVEVEELLAQLTTQAEVVRLAGAPDSETRDLVQEILARVEGIDGLLDEGPEPVLTSSSAVRT